LSKGGVGEKGARFLATAAFVGYMPVAPGTWGSIVGLLFHLAFRRWLGLWGHGMAILALSAAGTWASTVVERTSARKDPSIVVIDEVSGMLLGLYGMQASLWGLAVGFLLFRLLDIIKPFPCRWVERAPGGWGIMADDVIAGIYTNLLLRAAAIGLPMLLLGGAAGR
jgi:phosphatidylglycerophosphatase A